MRARLIAMVGTLLTVGAARAAPLDAVLFPSAPLTADGERAHLLRLYLVDHQRLVEGVPQLKVARGALVGAAAPASDGGVALRYRPPRVTAPATDTLTVTLRGRTTTLPIAIEPAGRLQLQLEVPPLLLLARGATATVKLHVRDAAGRPASAPLRAGASVGKLSAPREVAPGEYQLVFTPPEERYPQVAILAVLAISDGAFAAGTIRLAARVTVDGEGEPGAVLRVSVDGREAAPVTIGADGRFTLPLVVPPGGRAIGVSTDKLGNQQRREIDLALPPFPRLVLDVVPSVLPADGRARAEVVAFAVDARGNPERLAPPALTADAGALAPPQPRGDGSTVWTLTAPSGVGAGAVVLRAPGAEARVALRPGPPRAVEILPPREPLAAGSDAPATVEVRVSDGAGSPVAGATLSAALAGGRVTGVRELGGGRYQVELVPPRDLARGSAKLHVEVAGVPPGPPRRVTLHPLPNVEGDFAAEAWLDDDLGLPVAGAPIELAAPDGKTRAASDRYGTARVRFPPPPGRVFRVTAQPASLPGVSAALDYLVVGGVAYSVGSVAGGGVVEAGEPPSFPAADATLPLTPAAPIELRVTVEPKQPRAGEPVRVRVALRGASQLVYQASGGTLTVVRAPSDGTAELRFTPPADARPGSRYLVSITDARTRVTAFTEIVVR